MLHAVEKEGNLLHGNSKKPEKSIRKYFLSCAENYLQALL